MTMSPNRYYHRDPEAHGRKATVAMWLTVVGTLGWIWFFHEGLLAGEIQAWITLALLLWSAGVSVAMAQFDVVFDV